MSGAAPAGDAVLASRAAPTLPALFRLVALDACESTNDEARRRAQDGAAEGTLVWARRQTGGRGRRGRAWSSPEGNLFASLVLRPGCAPVDAAQISFLAAVAVGEVASALVPGMVRLKWPNDVLVDGAKVAGILLESETDRSGAVDWVVLGIGINVLHSPIGVDYPAVGLRAAGAEGVTVTGVLERLARSLDAWYGRWLTHGFAPVRAAWRNAATGLGGPVTVRLAAETFTGRFVDLDEGGGLVVETASGTRRVTAGDVFFG